MDGQTIAIIILSIVCLVLSVVVYALKSIMCELFNGAFKAFNIPVKTKKKKVKKCRTQKN